MIIREIPLLDLFNRLRQYGLPLGVDDYMILLRALQAGFGIEDPDSLRHLCSLLWIKSKTDKRLFDWIYQQYLRQPSVNLPETQLPEEQEIIPQSVKKERSERLIEERLSMILPVVSDINEYDLSQVVQAVHYNGRSEDMSLHRIKHIDDYFPITRRQMKQSWRHLRSMVREGPLTDLDILATIETIAREGVIEKLILLPSRQNRADLVMIVDQGGSMVPFHSITRQLIETAQRGGRIRQAGIYYFHDYPDKYLYSDSTQLDALLIDKVFSKFNEHTTVLIVSDAGASRGRYDRERVRRTSDFIQQIKKVVYRFAWLNPMPRHRWRYTTAGDISKMIPMFEMSRTGLDKAVNVLQGKYIYTVS
jgi:uncharacterized protein with von Willebrand factor type A (vWA) domain